MQDRQELLYSFNLPALDQALTAEQMTRCLVLGPPLSRTIQGTTADIYQSKIWGFDLDRETGHALARRLERPFKRIVGIKGLLIKVVKPNNPRSMVSNETLLRREVEMTSRPEIQPFAVATSSVKTDTVSRRPCIVEERASGLDILDPQDMSKIEEIDLVRIIYQLLMVSEAFHKYGVSPEDIAKDFYYYPYPSVKRVLLFDLSYHHNIPASGKDRAKTVIKDVRNTADKLRDFLLKKIPEEKKHRITEWLKNIEEVKFQSFYDVAKSLEQEFRESFGSTFSNEYTSLTGSQPGSLEAHKGKITPDEIKQAEAEIQSEEEVKNREAEEWKRQKTLLNIYGDNSPLPPDILARFKTDFELQTYRSAAETRILSEIKNGWKRNRFREIELTSFPEGHPIRKFLEIKSTDGRILLDHLLDRLVSAGLITSE